MTIFESVRAAQKHIERCAGEPLGYELHNACGENVTNNLKKWVIEKNGITFVILALLNDGEPYKIVVFSSERN